MEHGTGRTEGPPRKLLKCALYGLACVTLALAGAILYLVLTFDPRDYHARIVEFVRDKTGRTLDIRGDIELSVWPDLAVRLGALTLSERDSAEPFASVESARLTLRLAPLIDRELVVSELVLVGARVTIVRFEDGGLNVDDLLQGDGSTPQFDIGRVAVERSTIVYRDLRSGEGYVADDLALETGRLANGVVTPVELASRLRDERGTFDVTAAVQGRLELDSGARRYTLDQASVKLDGRIPGVHDLAFRAKGNAAFEGTPGAFLVRAFEATLEGTHGTNALEIALKAANLRLTAGTGTAETLRMALAAKGAGGTTDVTFATAALSRAQDHIGADAATFDVVLERGLHRYQGRIATGLAAEIVARKLTLTGLSADFVATGQRLPRQGVAGAVSGDAHLDFAQQTVRLDIAGKVAHSTVKVRLTSTGFSAPVYSFAVGVDRLDLDRYAPTGRPRQVTQDAHNDLLAPFADLPATGSLDVGVLTAAGMTARNVRLALQ